MKITYTEINGRRYAYTCTSERVPGKKNPVSKRVYLGIVDPETGEIIPKKGIKETDLVIDRGFKVKSYGDAAIVLAVAKRLGLTEDLEKAFGDSGRRILAIAIAQAVRPSSSDSVDRTLGESYILESLGIDTTSIDRRWVVDTVNSFDTVDAACFFRIRGKRSYGRLYLMPLTVSLTRAMNDPLRSLHPQLRSDEVAVTVLVDVEGNLLAFVVMDDPSKDPASLIGLMTRLKGVGYRPLLVSDTLSAPTIRLTDFVINGLDFIVPYPISSVQYQYFVKSTEDVCDCTCDIQQDGSRIVEESVGLMMDRDTNRFISRSDSGFDDCGIRLRAFLSFNPNINSDVAESVNKIVNSIKKRLNGTYSGDPDASLRSVAGELSDLFRVSTNKDCIMKVSVRRDVMADLRRNMGRALVLTTGPGWEEVSRARALRRELLESVYQYYHGSRWIMEYRGRGVIGYNQIFVEFLVAMMYTEIRRILTSEGIDDSIMEVLYTASSLKLLVTPAGDIMSSVDRRTRKLLKVFDVDISSSAIRDVRV